MLGRFPSRTVILTCLLIAAGSLFLRNIVYIGHSGPSTASNAQQARKTAAPIVLAYHERPPYYTTGSDHLLSGLVGEIAYTAFRRSGIPFTLVKMPPRRQLKTVENNHERICALGWFKTPEREAFARFTIPLYQDLPITVVTRSDIAFSTPAPPLAELFTRTDLTLLTRNSYSYGQYIDAALRQYNPASVNTTSDTSGMLEMIATGKADYFFAAVEEADEAITISPNPEKFTIILPADVPPGNMRYLLCSKLVTAKEIEQINTAITAVKKSAEGTAVLKQ